MRRDDVLAASPRVPTIARASHFFASSRFFVRRGARAVARAPSTRARLDVKTHRKRLPRRISARAPARRSRRRVGARSSARDYFFSRDVAVERALDRRRRRRAARGRSPRAVARRARRGATRVTARRVMDVERDAARALAAMSTTIERATTTRDRANDARLGSGARRETMDEAKGATATARGSATRAASARETAVRTPMIREARRRATTRTRTREGGEGRRGAREDGLKFKVGGDDETRSTRGASASASGGAREAVVVGMRLDALFDAAADRETRDSEAATRADDLTAFAAAMTPRARERAPRRALAVYEKTFVCGIGGCEKSYGSASSLCAHKRARHPGWREAATATKATTIKKEDDEDVIDGAGDAGDAVDDDGNVFDDASMRLARKRGASGLNDANRASALGAYFEIVAADAHGRLSSANRTKRRLVRLSKDAGACANDPSEPAERRAAAAAAARVFAAVEESVDGEQERASAWLHTLDDASRAVSKTQTSSSIIDARALDPDARSHAPELVRACVRHRIARVLRRAFVQAASPA